MLNDDAKIIRNAKTGKRITKNIHKNHLSCYLALHFHLILYDGRFTLPPPHLQRSSNYLWPLFSIAKPPSSAP